MESESGMKNCRYCKFADWKRSVDGKLHRSGEGKCTYKVKMPVLPASFYYVINPYLSGGIINRKKDFEDHCPCYLED